MECYDKLIVRPLTGDLRHDTYQFLVDNGRPDTAQHCLDVADEARKIALQYGVDPDTAVYSGYLHDISAVIPNDERIAVANKLGIEVLPEEETFPMIIHQKLSRQMAIDLFKVDDHQIIDAAGCHTTLRASPTELDKVLFVADKIAWDQPGNPPYLNEIKQALEQSLDAACFSYIDYLWQRREQLKVVHPWLKDAYYELRDEV
ncbi:bis(5'-nucleosyl)-tetraphosphatase (symmetrical) YqeK [Paenibacillus sp. SC116]|uniref:bis(5'-nucleosyl)-tetraphosphatase (symmetrical) YqeK n=1 Tax=Paenibacillus sp. SC116 TaxID=2968986 RepID=UPI00215ADA73|nr:bis(5'-nucleosyl)-tetraphosphatase (symmetrical) YqeK [Paenibacillus sp. SC116]MCR8845884.1 bis(5'-nucleosyl)-tetraphosphatase (symmetrical) YqeK [Paenibacillus sp. SC116]